MLSLCLVHFASFPGIHAPYDFYKEIDSNLGWKNQIGSVLLSLISLDRGFPPLLLPCTEWSTDLSQHLWVKVCISFLGVEQWLLHGQNWPNLQRQSHPADALKAVSLSASPAQGLTERWCHHCCQALQERQRAYCWQWPDSPDLTVRRTPARKSSRSEGKKDQEEKTRKWWKTEHDKKKKSTLFCVKFVCK